MKEIFGSVSYYGIGDIYRNYCGYSNFIPLPVSIQHGWTLVAVDHDANSAAPENWYWSKDTETEYLSKYKNIRTRSVGAPFLYHLANINYRKEAAEFRKGSIVFPAHSSHFVGVSQDYKLYAEMLEQLPEEYKPITVCIYYLDQEKGMDKPFIDKGFHIVSNGSSLYSKDFLDNFIRNTQDKLYAFSNEPTSALIYASLLGLTCFNYGPQADEFMVEEAPQNEHKMFEQRKVMPNHWRNYFKFPDCDVKVQRDYCEKIAGKEFVLKQKEMNLLLYKLLFSRKFILSYFFYTYYKLTFLVKFARAVRRRFIII